MTRILTSIPKLCAQSLCAAILAMLPCWGFAQSMPPDNWGGAKAHVGISSAIGVISRGVIKDPMYAWGACMVPGVAKEAYTYFKRPEPGYTHGLFSARDILSNGVGCAVGVAVGGLVFTPNSILYRKEF